jgi:trans-aconitate methyltransferase
MPDDLTPTLYALGDSEQASILAEYEERLERAVPRSCPTARVGRLIFSLGRTGA